ncbi:MAG: ABC transporter ATP-binding protein/permease [bacterium]|nr:ABC transporter ATP-binding protein/permease [bacterium]MCM1374566.1 ABC transporter ATP-binding protein/permease [Muribaculum sp.]
MRRENITIKALKIYHAYNPCYFPLRLGQTVFQNIPTYFNLWMSAEIVTALYEGRSREELYLLVGITLLGNLLGQMLEAILNRCVQSARETLENNEAAAFNRKTLSLDYDKLEDPQIRLLRRKIVENSNINFYGVVRMRDQIEGLMSHAVRIVFSLALLVEMISLLVRVPFSWLSGVLFAAMAGFLMLSVFFRSWSGKRIAAVWEKIGDLMLRENRYGTGYCVSGLDNRIYRQQAIIDSLYEKLNADHLTAFSYANKKSYLWSTPEMVMSRLSELCTYLVICLYCILGAFPVGSIIKYVGILGNISQSVGGMFFGLSNLKNNERFLETYLEFFAIQNDMYQGSLAVEKRSDKKFEIVFDRVSFRYAGAEQYALRDISLRIGVGQRLAVVGMNGSGKTTFIKLLCRLYDPTEGEIHMNDFNIRKYDYRQYLDLFSVVFQDYNLLALPLGCNVASAATWDSVKAERVLREVGLGERYEEMPQKLETPLYKNFDEDGVNISGGEAQKIALARALYRDAPFIILDEPTAALDPVAEAEIYSRFDEIVGDKTAIYISHRLSSCRFCDKIAVFDGGRIVQVGTHEELLADERGKYYELWHAQAQYYA